jgi:hypothetical protein
MAKKILFTIVRNQVRCMSRLLLVDRPKLDHSDLFETLRACCRLHSCPYTTIIVAAAPTFIFMDIEV